MRGLIATVSSLVLVAAFAAPVLAQQATKIGQHNAWGTYSYQSAGGKVCSNGKRCPFSSRSNSTR